MPKIPTAVKNMPHCSEAAHTSTVGNTQDRPQKKTRQNGSVILEPFIFRLAYIHKKTPPDARYRATLEPPPVLRHGPAMMVAIHHSSPPYISLATTRLPRKGENTTRVCINCIFFQRDKCHYFSQNCLGDVSSLAVNGTAPSSVIRNVCSNCAVRLPSFVAAVHLSGHITLLAGNSKSSV